MLHTGPQRRLTSRQEIRGMALFDKLKDLFRPDAPEPPDALRLNSESVTTLAHSLQSLPVGLRGWIPLRDAWRLFSPGVDEAEAFGERDEDGRKRLEDFAAQPSHRSDFSYMPIEGRLYFTRK